MQHRVMFKFPLSRLQHIIVSSISVQYVQIRSSQEKSNFDITGFACIFNFNINFKYSLGYNEMPTMVKNR